jgi:hypothetical protein
VASEAVNNLGGQRRTARALILAYNLFTTVDGPVIVLDTGWISDWKERNFSPCECHQVGVEK